MATQSGRAARQLNLLASTSLVGLIILCLAWEIWLAPLRPGGSLLVLKTLPLLAPLFGILHGKRYTHQWASLLCLFYVIEGIVRATSDQGPSVAMAWAELILATAFFIGTVGYARLTRPSLPVTPGGSGDQPPGKDDSAH